MQHFFIHRRLFRAGRSFVRGECFINLYKLLMLMAYFLIFAFIFIARFTHTHTMANVHFDFMLNVFFFVRLRFVRGENCPSIILMLCRLVFTFILIDRSFPVCSLPNEFTFELIIIYHYYYYCRCCCVRRKGEGIMPRLLCVAAIAAPATDSLLAI